MRDFAKISPQFWINEKGREIRRLGVDAQLIAFYFYTNPHASMIGIYYLPIALIAHETGFASERVKQALDKLSRINFCSYDERSEYIWVHEMAFDQIDTELKPHDNRVKGIHTAFYSLPKLPFLNQFVEKYSRSFHLSKIEESLEPLASKEKENQEERRIKEKNKEKAIRILNFFNEKAEKNYQENSNSLSLIIARLNSGVTERQCFQLIAKMAKRWKGHAVMDQHLNIETLFGPKFEKYLADLPKETDLPEEEMTEEDTNTSHE